jgi:predicted TIM-barrel fold metal-dependent hydrolase
MEYKVISADNHILEPRELFVTRMPKQFRDRAPRVTRGADGGDGWSFTDGPPERTFGIEATAGREIRISGYKWEEILPGNYNGAAHIKDMSEDGVDAAVLFPSVPLYAYVSDDADFALALIQTYNDWLFDDFVAAGPERLIGLAMLPVNHGMDIVLAEFERCLKKGAKAFHIPAYPNTPYISDHYDPLWAAAAQAGKPLCLHRTSGGNDPAGKSLFQFKVPGVNVAGTVIRFFSAVEPMTLLIFTGVFRRHPKLKIVHAEVNFGWVPFWKETMDDQFERQKGWAKFPIDSKPSEALGKNVFFTVLDDKVGFDLVQSDPQLADLALFSIDYPHSVCLWPNSADYIEKATVNVDPVSKTKILAGNSVQVFGLD